MSCLLAPGSGVYDSPACVFSGAASACEYITYALGAQDKANRHWKLEDGVWLQTCHIVCVPVQYVNFVHSDLHIKLIAHCTQCIHTYTCNAKRSIDTLPGPSDARA